jgi:late competence protein required for DNA uptake (superfamily II DNA/RNA helicase)
MGCGCNKKRSFGFRRAKVSKVSKVSKSRRTRKVLKTLRVKKSRKIRSFRRSRLFGGPNKGPVKCSMCHKELNDYFMCPKCHFTFCRKCLFIDHRKAVSLLNNDVNSVFTRCPVDGCTGILKKQ